MSSNVKPANQVFVDSLARYGFSSFLILICGEVELIVIFAHRNGDLVSFVSMLNDASIDFEQEPLGHCENDTTDIDDKMEGQGGDEEGLEEVDAGVFEEVVNKTTPCRRTTNYSKIKDEALIKA
jgi:hypothetical protein